MLIVALVLAVIGVAALVTAVVTSNELVAWVCIGASGLGVLLLIVDAIRDRVRRRSDFPAPVPAVVLGVPAETTEAIEPVVETTEVFDSVPVDDFVDIETGSDTASYEDGDTASYEDGDTASYEDENEEGIAGDISGDISGDIAEEEHPEELVYDDPFDDLPSDDEADFPEPAEEAAIHVVSDSEIDRDDDETATELPAPVEESPVEVHYAPSSQDSAPSVVYTYSEDDETEYVDTEEREHRDQ